jgi:hypothetical protein
MLITNLCRAAACGKIHDKIMDAGSPYTDVPLDTSTISIRLIKVLQETEDDGTLKCRFETFPLADCPPYTALSYTWGPSGDEELVSVGGHYLFVRKNLWRFLRLAQKHARIEWLWADAMSIDQSNTGERNHQVNLMKQIYSTVNFCLI